MEEHEKNEADSPTKNPDPANKSDRKGLRIFGLNLLILVVYSVVSKFSGDGIADAFFIAIHFCACMIVAAIMRSWAWVLSGLLVLVIGFATCVELLGR